MPFQIECTISLFLRSQMDSYLRFTPSLPPKPYPSRLNHLFHYVYAFKSARLQL